MARKAAQRMTWTADGTTAPGTAGRPGSRRPATRGGRAGKLVAAVAASAALALSLSGCVTVTLPGGKPAATSGSQEGLSTGTPEELKDYYGQKVAWASCEHGAECASIKVPVDYSNPQGGSIEIAVIKIAATGKSEGSLFINPGGPGGSGYDFVNDSAQWILSDELRKNYDLVGFDPRGVKRSAPVTCLTDRERDAQRAVYYDPFTPDGLAKSIDEQRQTNQACEANTGPVLAHADTESAARDMDILRAALRNEKLDYLGYSYGTFLGSTYATLFPDRVGRMVLDGALDSTLTQSQLTIGQAKAFERSLHVFVEWCQRNSGCPLSGNADEGVQRIQKLMNQYATDPPQANDGRVVTVASFVSGLIVPLYSTASWPNLRQALAAALVGDPSPMMQLADFGADRDSSGSYTSNSAFAFNAINCLDYSVDSAPEAMRNEAAELVRVSPTLGKYMAYGGIACDGLKTTAVRKVAPANYSGKAPVVVIGTTGDPATPYEWAQNLRKQLGNASLLTWEGEGHTAYGRAGNCITNAVDDYFVKGTTPADGLRCT
ncbi:MULTISPECIES: alpha/beta hydrolase [Arthrobacter]|uniref:Alpha/beta hydrolase n=2 Tax=Arthrobacter TaxID=1663 RepID=A0ABU9KHD7_9MICC|nr:alpha/beta hydrolase [Arthrobacter sp. YJM1]MDP5226678.1 alpha/beta hydrolase [Arthrobacter sp. YJM1]